MMTFHEFMAMHEEAPVAGGGPSAPSSGSNKKVNDLSVTKRELGAEFDGLDDEDIFKEPIASFEPLYVGGQPTTSSPVFVDVEDSDEDGMTGKVLYSLQNRMKMRNPNGTQYKGKLKDRRIRLRKGKHGSNRSIDDLMLKPFAQGGGMVGDPMGGGMGMM